MTCCCVLHPVSPVRDVIPKRNLTILGLDIDFHVGNGTSGADNGNVFGITNYKDTTRSQTFTYDALNRLASAQNAGTNCAATVIGGKSEYWGNSYGYDAWGNLLNKSVTKCSAENLSVAALPNNQLTGYGYDAAGNMTNDPTDGVMLSYDQENRITGAADYTYTYDADGNRVKKSNGSTGTLYWYMTPGIVAESDLSGTLKAEYVFFDGERVARKDFPGNAVSYYFSDHLKTASVITDSAGNIKSESDFYPWGGEIQFVNNDSNHYKFTGKERDAETQLDYFGARHYSNGLGRWVSADWSPTPIPVPYADFHDPQSLNLYGYVRNIPTTGMDADGHCDSSFCAVAAGIAVGTGNFLLHNNPIYQAAQGIRQGYQTLKGGAAASQANSQATLKAAGTVAAAVSGNPVAQGQIATSVANTWNGMSTTDKSAAVTEGVLTAAGIVASGKIPGPVESTPSKVDNIINTIDQSGFNVTANPKTGTQTGNVTITNPSEPGVKLNLRSETHPLPESGGQPVPHVNVERIDPGPKNRPQKTSNEHITD